MTVPRRHVSPVRPACVSGSGHVVVTDPGGDREAIGYQGSEEDAAALAFSAATQVAAAGCPVEWWVAGRLHQRFRI